MMAIDLDTLICELDPARDIDVPVADAAQARRAFIELTSRRRPPRRSRRHRSIFVLAAVPIVVAAVLVALLVISPSGPSLHQTTPGQSLRHTTASAATVLRKISVVADQQPILQPGPGQYVYQGSQSLSSGALGNDRTGSIWINTTMTVQKWMSDQAAGKSIESTSAPAFARPSDRAAWTAAGQPALPPTHPPIAATVSAGAGSDAFNGLVGLAASSLSTDPATLRAQVQAALNTKNTALQEVCGCTWGDISLVTGVEAVLESWEAAPTVRAAAYQVLATLPGVTVQSSATDHAGAAGEGVTATQDGTQVQLVVDPDTSSVIGSNSTVVDAAQAGLSPSAQGLTTWTVFQPYVVVGSLGATS
jgi:hypothetical protein